ncbi:MAG: hypothetical protein WKG07_09745 [Hymenobacter sp.]
MIGSAGGAGHWREGAHSVGGSGTPAGTLGPSPSTRWRRQPLMNQPGERFTYGLSVDVLGRLIEVLSGSAARPIPARAAF